MSLLINVTRARQCPAWTIVQLLNRNIGGAFNHVPINMLREIGHEIPKPDSRPTCSKVSKG